MKITVINGTERHGVTYRLKEMFLSEFEGMADITEYYLPKDCPDFCIGCTSCFLKGEHTCKDADKIGSIEKSLLEADLIVMASPAYVFHATGAIVILTQCLGAGAKSAAKDMKHSLSWWGISQIGVFTGKLMGDIIWDKLPQKKQSELTSKVKRLSQKFARIDYTKAARTNFITKVKFLFCRLIQKSLHQADPEYLDGKYWDEHGWLGSVRPWK